MDIKKARYNQERYNMVHQQVRTWDVLNSHILNLMSQIPREHFVPESLRSLAYSDSFLPIGYNQVMLPPKMVGRLLQAIPFKSSDTVLEVGTGTGYITALLCRWVKKVVSIEIVPQLFQIAQQNLSDCKNHALELINTDGALGYPSAGPFDAIIITGGLPFLPKEFDLQLKPGGHLVGFLGKPPAMQATLRIQQGKNQFVNHSLFETVVPELINARQPDHFEF